MGKWQRDPSVPYPSVWRKFQVKSKTSDEVFNFQIEDATMESVPDVIQLMIKNYLPDEPVAKCFDLVNDAESKPFYTGFYTGLVSTRTVLACYKIGDDSSKELVGCNMTMVMEPEDSYDNFVVSPLIKEYVSVFSEAEKGSNLFEIFNVPICLKAAGLAVDHKYRGLGIATEILKSREELCKALKIPLTATQFTSGGSQAAARKAGYQMLKETKYADIKKVLPHLPLDNVSHPVTQYLYKVIEL